MNPDLALRHAIQLVEDGADILDIGAQSSNVQSGNVPWELEWERIRNIHSLLKNTDWSKFNLNPPKISIDSFRPEVLERCLELDFDYWNDITAIREPKSLEILSSYFHSFNSHSSRSSADAQIFQVFDDFQASPELIIMFSHNRGDRAVAQSNLRPETIVDEILRFFEREIHRLVQANLPTENIIFDPGMGFFLGEDPNLSVSVIQGIPRLKKELGRILVSVSRKSFLGNILGGLPPDKRNHATLSCELNLASQAVDYIRTHEPLPLVQGIKVWKALSGK